MDQSFNWKLAKLCPAIDCILAASRARTSLGIAGYHHLAMSWVPETPTRGLIQDLGESFQICSG